MCQQSLVTEIGELSPYAGGMATVRFRAWVVISSLGSLSLYLDHPGFFVHDANAELEPSDACHALPQTVRIDTFQKGRYGAERSNPRK